MRMVDRARLFQSLDNAVTNGYVYDFERTGKTIYDVDPRVLAVDTCDCDADFEGCDLDDLIPLIREWQAYKRDTYDG